MESCPCLLHIQEAPEITLSSVRENKTESTQEKTKRWRENECEYYIVYSRDPWLNILPAQS